MSIPSSSLRRPKCQTLKKKKEQEKPTELNIVDLQNLKAIIDVAAKRGAFSAGEMAAVGTVYNKLDTFLNSVVPAQTENNQKPE